MGRSLVQLYALTVCFFTLMCLVIVLGLGIYDVVRIVRPDFTVQDDMLWQSNELYRTYRQDKKDLPDAEITALREQGRRAAVDAERRGAEQRLVFLGIILGIDIVVYAIHWRIARKAELIR